jgi:probable F420-dependent oxidoreductase
VALGAVAAVTRRARLGTNVLIAPLRPAVLLAKMVATLDVLSGGRVDLGVGVGWQLDEFAAVGVPFEGVGGRLEDLVGACQTLWRGGPASFASPTVSFTDMVCSPTPVQGSGLPIWFGGSARRTTARRVARLGHGWSPIGNTTPDDIGLGCRLIAEECEAVGRDPAEIAVRCFLPLIRGAGGRPDLAATMGGARALARLGATVVQLAPLGEFVEKAADVGPFLSRAVVALGEATA